MPSKWAVMAENMDDLTNNVSGLTSGESGNPVPPAAPAKSERTWAVIPQLTRLDTIQLEGEGDKNLVDFIRYRKDSAYVRRSGSVIPGARMIADVGEWIKFLPPGSDPGNILRRFLNLNTILFYPMILMKEKLVIQMKMIAEFSRDETPAGVMVEDLRNINRESIIKYFEWRSLNPREIPSEFEEKPGEIIEYSTDYTLLSVVEDLVSECQETFKKNLKRSRIQDIPMQASNLDIIKNDFIHSAENLLQPVMRELHRGLYLAAHEGYVPGESIIPHMEVVYVYRVMGDVLEHHINQLSEKLQKQGFAQLQSDLVKYYELNPPQPGKIQNRKRLLGLVDAAELHLKKIPGQMSLELFDLTDAFRAVCAEMDKEVFKEAESKIMAKVSEFSELITSNSKEHGLLTKINPAKIFSSEDFKESDNFEQHAGEVITRLTHNPDFCFCKMKDSGDYYFAWLVFLLKIEAKAVKNKRKNPEEYQAVMEIKADLGNTHPDNLDYPAMLEEYSKKSGVNHFQMAVYEIDNAKAVEDLALEKLKKDYTINQVAGAALGTIAALIGIGAGYAVAVAFGLLVSISAIISGILFFIFGYFSGRRYFSREKEMERQRLQNLDLKSDSGKKVTGIQNKEVNPIDKMAEQTFSVIFPNEFESYLDRIYSAKALEEAVTDNIENFKRVIPRLADESDEKAISELVYAIKNHPDTVQIIVPPHYAVSGYPDSIVMKKSDLRSDVARRQLADYYLDLFHSRDAMQARKNPLVAGYYRFFINTFETSEYKKYL